MILMVGGTGATAAPALADSDDEAVMVGAGKAADDEAENGAAGSHGSRRTLSLSKLILTCDHRAIDGRRLRRPRLPSSSSDSFWRGGVGHLQFFFISFTRPSSSPSPRPPGKETR